MVMFFRINKMVKKHRMINGVLRCEMSGIIIESIFPILRNKKKSSTGTTIVIIAIWKTAKYFSGFEK